MSVLRIAVVYPDLLGTYGDTGNGVILERRAAERGIAAELLMARSSEPLPEALARRYFRWGCERACVRASVRMCTSMCMYVRVQT